MIKWEVELGCWQGKMVAGLGKSGDEVKYRKAETESVMAVYFHHVLRISTMKSD